MVKDGKLDKYGQPNENTPSNWSSNYVDYSKTAMAPANPDATLVVKKEAKKEEPTETPAPVEGEKKKKKREAETPAAEPEAATEAPAEEPKKKKKKVKAEESS
eukprot:TRINITY_DN1094_c0_g1_i2.p2 TRINITY_DN1094_c0_g1~~TRINITY_DN1094_c0_g1_i2.p2  ORF type:complete len:103 (-),score=75.02 TRINITY_DN1094_c0_g1_i2:94-402(-)